MASIGKIIVDLAANTSSFQADMGKAARVMNRRMGNMQRAARRVERAMSGVTRGLKGLAAVAGIGLGIGAAKSFLDQADALSKLSRRLGANVENLSAFRLATEKTGVPFNTFTMALQRMVRRSAEAAKGTGEAKAAIAELGISAQKFNTLSVTDKLLALADAFKTVPEQSDRVRLAFKLFDSEGVSVLQTLEGGAGGVKKLTDQARAMGDVLSKKTAGDIERFNDRLTVAGSRLRGIKTAAAEGAIRGFDRLRAAFGPSGVFAAMGDGLESLGEKALKAVPTLRLLQTVAGFDPAAPGRAARQAHPLFAVSDLRSQAGAIADSNNRLAGSFSAVKDAAEKTGSAFDSVYDPAAKKAAALAAAQKKQMKQAQALASFARRFILPDLARTSQLRGSARVVSASRFAFNDASSRESDTNKTLKRIEGILESIDRKTARDQLRLALQ